MQVKIKQISGLQNIIDSPISIGVEYSQSTIISSPSTGNEFQTEVSMDFTPFADSVIQVNINGLLERGSYTDKLGGFYFSSNGGVTVKRMEDLESGDKLYWNGLIKGYQLSVGDAVTISYDKEYLSYGSIMSGTSSGSGVSGSSGVSGTVGSSGSSGVSGIAGTSGTRGTSGSSGVSGTVGSSGSSGISGTSGTRGTSGSSGVSGAVGSSGSSGVSGAVGSSGSSGVSGTSGLGFTFRGSWNNYDTYYINDVVEYQGSSYTVIGNSIAYEPTVYTNYWKLSASSAYTDGLIMNSNEYTGTASIPSGQNAMLVGPITLTGAITVSEGAVLKIV